VRICGQDDFIMTLEHEGKRMFLEAHYPPYHLWIGKTLHCFIDKKCIMEWLEQEIFDGSVRMVFNGI
jgi:hypothetical protein